MRGIEEIISDLDILLMDGENTAGYALYFFEKSGDIATKTIIQVSGTSIMSDAEVEKRVAELAGKEGA